jgi:hypothetical protein
MTFDCPFWVYDVPAVCRRQNSTCYRRQNKYDLAALIRRAGDRSTETSLESHRGLGWLHRIENQNGGMWVAREGRPCMLWHIGLWRKISRHFPGVWSFTPATTPQPTRLLPIPQPPGWGFAQPLTRWVCAPHVTRTRLPRMSVFRESDKVCRNGARSL